MPSTRKIHRVMISKPTLEGAGVHLRRGFGFHETHLTDPFLLLDDFRGDSPEQYEKGFPWHPHRGIETITYMLAGRVEHGDSLGNGGVIAKGDVQWMNSGSGIIHQEMPKGDPDGRMEGFQLWVNLPRASKMSTPNYQEVKNDQIPELELGNGVKVRVICGEVAGKRGPVTDVTISPEYLDVHMPPGRRFIHPTPADQTAIAYVYEGSGIFGGETDPFAYEQEGISYFDTRRDAMQGNHTVIVFEPGDQIEALASKEGVRFIFVSARPLKEPVAWYGPIVMNTEDELRTAFDELNKGTFIKERGKGNPA